jgi:hypothetical protein
MNARYWILAVIFLVVLITVGLIVADAYTIGYETGRHLLQPNITVDRYIYVHDGGIIDCNRYCSGTPIVTQDVVK